MWLLIILLVWLVWTYIGYKMAEKRGRSLLVGAGLGFILGIFGLIIIAIWGESEEKKAERIANVIEKTKNCK